MSAAHSTKIFSILKRNTILKCIRECDSNTPWQVSTNLSSLAHQMQDSLSCSASYFSHSQHCNSCIGGTVLQSPLCHRTHSAQQWAFHHHKLRSIPAHAQKKWKGRQEKTESGAGSLLNIGDKFSTDPAILKHGKIKEAHQIQANNKGKK